MMAWGRIVILPASLSIFILANPLIAAINVSESTGAGQNSVPIQVPGFRGLEPNVALVYHSGGGNGIVGVGWSLGFPSIERQGADGGSPQYDSSDSYSLGGQDLRPCGASSSPGCLAGGTHFTEHENYERITYDSGSDEWQVDSRNGTQSVYTPLIAATGGTFRWKLVTVTDILGNTVTYNWWCDTGKDCFPDNVTYNGYRVKLYYEATRPDIITYATGVSIAEIRQRLKSIKVELTSGAAIRAYKLTYAPSNSTGRSRLSSVQMYGKDVAIDGSGNITGGTSLPAENYTYSTDVSDHSFTGGGSWSSGCAYTFGTGDFDGDGRQDFYCHHAWGTGALDVGLSTGSGFNKTSWGQACAGSTQVMSTGDFDGDGKTDFLCKRSNNALDVGLSSGSGLSWSQWTSSWCASPTAADFNGDGKTDLACHTPDVKVRLSTGSSFAPQTTWISNWCRPNGGTSWGEQWGVSAKVLYPADYNGDGNTDLLCRSTGGLPGGHWVALSNGSNAFAHDGKWLAPMWCGGDDQYSLGDFNGDGKTDYACYDNAALDRTFVTKVAFSDGSKFQDKGQWLGAMDCKRLSFADMNGDGRTDLWCHTEGNWQTWVGLSNGATAFSDWALWKNNWCTANKVVAGDYNGDGKTDLSCRTSTDTMVAPSGSLLGKTDLLTSLQNSLGGTTSIAYVPGTQWSSLQAPPPGQLSSDDGQTGAYVSSPSTHPLTPGGPTVSSVTISDGRGWSKTTTYQYSGGLYDASEQMWLGFGYSIRTEPALPGETAGPWTKTWFLQEVAARGATDVTESHDGAGKILSAVDNEIETEGDGESEPFTAKVRSRTSEIYDGTTTSRCSFPCSTGERYYQWFDYDEYGNLRETQDYGNYDASGDEATTVSEFYPNTSAYIVNRLARTTSYFGIGTTGAILTDSKLAYDGSGVYNQPPTAGLQTNGAHWLNVGNRWIPQCSSAACVEYDLFGNVTKVKESRWVNGGSNPVTAETVIQYETTYNKFPTSVTNALGHVTQTPDWDELCEAPESTVNPNLQETTTTYDDLCRHDRTEGPLGSFVQSLYVDVGDPDGQYTETQTPSADGTGVYWAKSFFDGLGRTYKTESRSGESGKNVLSGEMTFNERGQAATTALPRFTGESQFVRTPVYDVRDRVVEMHYNDTGSNKETYSYGLTWTAHANAQGHYTASSRDATGLINYVVEYSTHTPAPGGPIYTTTIRDVDDRTDYVLDDDGNAWATVFDSFGRPVAVVDPDSGTEIREYYDSGELKASTNALYERTELEYDKLGRLVKKTTRKGAAGEQVTTFTFDQARTNYFNVGFLTKMNDSAGYREDDYDPLGRPAKSLRNLDSVNHVFEFSYNAAGLPSSRTYPDSDTISWSYDGGGNLETETGTVASSEYDAAGRLKSRTFANSVVSTYSYSATRGWVEAIDTAKSPTVIQDLAYSYFADGMVQSVASARPGDTWSWTYGYDDLNRLLTATNSNPALSQSFTYNDIGNIVTSPVGTYTYPGTGTARPHAVSTAGSRSYSYNAVGQMTSRNGTVIQWNGDGKPSSIGGVSFVYDGVGERLKKISGGQTTRYLGGDYEIAHDGTITKYLNGGKKVGSQYFMHHRDHLGSIQSVTDASGAEVRGQKHKPFGDQFGVTGSHLESKGWIGEREEETELVYLNARYYDPEIGRFTAPDPLALPGQGLNRYSYALNDPINQRDPSGLTVSSVGMCQVVTQVTTAYCFPNENRQCIPNPSGEGVVAIETVPCSTTGNDNNPSGWGTQATMSQHGGHSHGGGSYNDPSSRSPSPNVCADPNSPACKQHWVEWCASNPGACSTTTTTTTTAGPTGPTDNPPDCMTALGCNSNQQVIEQTAQIATDQLAAVGTTWAGATLLAVPPAVAVLGSTGGLTTLGLSAAAGVETSAAAGALGTASGTYGRIVGWGTGQSPAATTQTIRVNINLTAQTIQSWARQGLPREWVQAQYNFYSQAFARGGAQWNNYQLIPRLALMKRILSMWPD